MVRTKPPNKRKRYPSILIRVFPRKPHRPTSGGCGAGGRSELNCYLRPQWSSGTLSSRKKDVLVERGIFLAILGAVFHSFFLAGKNRSMLHLFIFRLIYLFSIFQRSLVRSSGVALSFIGSVVQIVKRCGYISINLLPPTQYRYFCGSLIAYEQFSACCKAELWQLINWFFFLLFSTSIIVFSCGLIKKSKQSSV